MRMKKQVSAQASGHPRILSALDWELGTDTLLQGFAAVIFTP